jgi:acetyltransferase-like isoleucine patch superfamily enzyme
MKNIFEKGMVPHIIIRILWMKITAYITTIIGNIYARFWGVKMRGRTLFYGLPIIRVYPGSEICLGGDNLFLSSTNYNSIGVNHPCSISTQSDKARLVIGDGCGFSGTTIGCAYEIRIGNRVRCGANTIITDTDWHTDDSRTTPDGKVIIEDDVWLGVNVIVLKGVTIGAKSIIGAGSIVTHSIPPNVMAAGIPAKVIRENK